MSKDFLAAISCALNEVTAYLGSTFTYKGTCYKAIINDLELSNDLKDGGLLESLATVIIVSRCVLLTEPKAGETLYVGSQKVRIEKVKVDEVSYEIHCRTAKQ